MASSTDFNRIHTLLNSLSPTHFRRREDRITFNGVKRAFENGTTERGYEMILDWLLKAAQVAYEESGTIPPFDWTALEDAVEEDMRGVQGSKD